MKDRQYVTLEAKLYFIYTPQALSNFTEQDLKDALYPDGITWDANKERGTLVEESPSAKMLYYL